MPHSVEEGKGWIRSYVEALWPKSVLDVGPGAGTYAKLLRGHVPYECTFTGLEIFEPYVERYELNQLYDEIIVGDAREDVGVDVYDVIILGDVLEHMSEAEAIMVWDRARATANRGVFASLPIYGYEQGALEGNEHEAHLHQWSHESVMAKLGGIVDSWQGQIVGCYRAEPS